MQRTPGVIYNLLTLPGVPFVLHVSSRNVRKVTGEKKKLQHIIFFAVIFESFGARFFALHGIAYQGLFLQFHEN